MIPMLRLQFIIFSLIGIGFFTRKKGLVSREGQKNITDLVINIILPCNIITSFTQELPDSALHDGDRNDSFRYQPVRTRRQNRHPLYH